MALLGAASAFQSCTRNGDDVWEDTKSAGRHMGRGLKALGGGSTDSRQVTSRGDFESIDDGYGYDEAGLQDCEYQEGGYQDGQPADYVPLADQANSRGDRGAPQPRETPGEAGSSIPGIDAFRDPSTIPQLAGIFRNIYFDYDSSLVKGQENLQIIHSIADFMRKNPGMYIFVEGHTDERGPQAYNFSLGSRRGNAIRNLLLSEGVSPDHVFTISYGKDRPVVLERHEEGWSKNRRAEFKVYER